MLGRIDRIIGVGLAYFSYLACTFDMCVFIKYSIGPTVWLTVFDADRSGE